MSTYATDDYEFSFAKRTLANLEFIENRVREEREAGLKDNEITDAFEVTQLLNSFIGLLVIPRARCFEFMDDNISFPKDSEAYTIFNKVISDPTRFKDTYHERVLKNEKWSKTDRLEKITPKTLVLRLRNAVSHDRLTIHPTSLRNNNVITVIEFSDK